MEIQDIMSRQLVTVSPDDTVANVRAMFQTWRFHHLLVVERRRLLGVISDRDLLKNLSPFIGRELAERSQDAALLDRKVHQIMTRKPITVPPDMAVDNAVRLLVHQNVSCLPVVADGGVALGIVTWKDLFRAMVPGVELPPLLRSLEDEEGEQGQEGQEGEAGETKPEEIVSAKAAPAVAKPVKK